MFNLFKGKKQEISFTLDRPDGVYAPGDTVGVTVEIRPEKDLKIQSAQVKLTGIERYQYGDTSISTDSDGGTIETTNYYWSDSPLFVSEENFLGEVKLPGGAAQQYSFQMSIPLDMLPTFTGEILHVHCKYLVKLARRLARDMQAETEFCVRTLAPGQNVQPGEYGVSNEPDQADLAFALPGLEILIGQQISGQLRVMPHKDFSAEVRLELVRRESVYYGDGNLKETTLPFKLAGNTRFVAEQPQTIPFQVVIPPDAPPSIETPNGRITWIMKGILARRLRQDTLVEQEILVYPAS